TIESLRRQTQERVEEGFIGINMAADTTGGKRVGVGLDNNPIHAMAMTSRKSDFTGDSDKIAVSLADKNAIVFVIKKNSSVLKKLTDWLVSLNADPITKKIDLPMLLIDDEADNASVNTSQEKEDPTTINKMIRKLASVFTKSNYVGFTATPFANVFIDPETTEKMETQDLFPEDFIVALPTPSNYIGPMKIFPATGKFHSQLNYIEDAGVEVEDGWPFYYKHKKDWQDYLPNSLTDALFTFYLANAIRDLRGDQKEHRSMLINISRFVKVQHYIKEQVEALHDRAYRSIKFNLSDNFEESMLDPTLKRVYKNWEKYYSSLEFTWKEIANCLFESIENIQIKVVNSSKSSEKLEYNDNESVRVVAIGGLALSRGLTLEGLIISYFYRNTCTYDVLMQMGRWFGYRKNYEDLFRIWTHKESAEWYAEIAEATEALKDDMSLMRELEQKPRNFGIRVRNNCSKLHITAANKMRNAADEYEYNSYYGGIVETPYVVYDAQTQKNNFEQVQLFVERMKAYADRFEPTTVNGAGTHNVMYNIPKVYIVELLRNIIVSRFCSFFDTKQITEFLEESHDSALDSWNVVFMDGRKSDDKNDQVIIGGKVVYKLKRTTCKYELSSKRLSLGQRGKLGGPTDGMLGIEEWEGESAETIIQDAKNQFVEDYKKDNVGKAPTSYSSDIWFKYIKKRKPVIIIYLVDAYASDNTQKKQAEQFRTEMNNIPVVGLAMGLPKSDNAALISKNKYKANKYYNWFEKDEIIAESEEEE
nr:Z1 domain-containing protein [Lachnospiraceae bacterium]